MRKIFFGISTLIGFVSFAQNDIQTAVFPDGTEVDYQVFSNEIKDMERLNVFLEINTRSTLTLGPSVSYTLPEVFISEVHLGFVEKQFGKFSIENTWFFKSSEKEKSFPITLKAISDGNTTTKFVTKQPVQIKKQFGARLGYLSGNYQTDGLFRVNAKANELSIGVSYSKSKFIKYKTLSGSKPREHSKFGRTNVYAEMINYHAIKNIITDELDYDYSIIPSKAKTGFRIGLEGQSGNSKFGLSYFLGVETPLSKLFFIQPFGGVGVYFSFL
jgi:hypothetical protein